MNLEQHIANDWAGNTVAYTVCMRLLEYFYSESAHPKDHYYFSELQDLTKSEQLILLEVLIYLSSSKLKVLEEVFLYVDDQNNFYEFDKTEIHNYVTTGDFINPHTGHILAKSDISIVYQLGSYFSKDV